MSYRVTWRCCSLLCCAFIALALPYSIAAADDWPQPLGPGRRACWEEKGILREFPAEGLKVSWRTPIGPGQSGAVVAGGRVFVSDYLKSATGSAERVLCLEEQTGKVLWTWENPEVDYKSYTWNPCPRSTPVVDGDRVYAAGAAGDIYCLGTKAGDLRWKVNLPSLLACKPPTWGYAGSAVVAGNLLISPGGGKESGRLIAFNKLTGQEVWRALPTQGDVGYGSPILIRAAGVEQLVFHSPGEVASVNPKTGEAYWRVPFEGGNTTALPVVDGDRLLVSNFHKGGGLLRLSQDKPGATLVWRHQGQSEAKTDGLHALISTPVIKDDHFYGICSYGQLRCLRMDTGARVWETQDVTRENKRWASAHIVRNREVYFLNNDRGELIIADLQPDGYHELARTQLIKPTTTGAGARELKAVNWALPCYANKHLIVRNDEEIIRVSLGK